MIDLHSIPAGTEIFMVALTPDGQHIIEETCPSTVLSSDRTSIQIRDEVMGEDFDYELGSDGQLHQSEDVFDLNPWLIYFKMPEGGIAYEPCHLF